MDYDRPRIPSDATPGNSARITSAPTATPARRATITASSSEQTGFALRGTNETPRSGPELEHRWNTHPAAETLTPMPRMYGQQDPGSPSHSYITTRRSRAPEEKPPSPGALSNESDYVQDLDDDRPTIEDRLIPVWEIFHVQSAR